MGRTSAVRWIVQLAAGLLLGAATTVGVAWGLAWWAPVAAADGRVALDGDHLKPWLLHLKRVGSERLIWFEKGRVYSKPGAGPAGRSSAAVSCWSFATQTRRSPGIVKGTIEIPEDIAAEITRTPATIWGIADDRRGWPLPAMRAVIVGTMERTSPDVYVSKNAVMEHVVSTQGAGNLAEVTALPLEPL